MPRLIEGQQAPDFEVEDIFGKKIKLSDYKNKKLLLSFFRYSGCPWCNLAIHQLALIYKQLHQPGLEVVAFVQSTKENIIQNIAERHVPAPDFPLVPDPDRIIYDMYGVETSIEAVISSIPHLPSWIQSSRMGFPQTQMDGNVLLVPAHFLIGEPDLTLHKAHYGKNFADSIALADIQAFLKQP